MAVGAAGAMHDEPTAGAPYMVTVAVITQYGRREHVKLYAYSGKSRSPLWSMHTPAQWSTNRYVYA